MKIFIKHIIYLWVFIYILLSLGCNLEDKEDSTDNSFVEDIKTYFSNAENQQKGVVDRFSNLYGIIHKDQLHLYDSLRNLNIKDWDYIHQIISTPDTSTVARQLNPDKIVFGWHPYWMGSAYESYQYELLSHVSWFSYDINENTGAPNNPEVVSAWKESGMIDKAKDANCKSLLTITCHQTNANAIFLANQNKQQEALIKQLLLLLEENQADGIDINFEQVPASYASHFTNFLVKISHSLKAVNKDYIISLVLPKIDWKKVYDIKKLTDEEIVDIFIVTGYDYHTRGSKTDGPVAPLKAGEKNLSIEVSIERYLRAGLDKEKSILGLPYYGALWMSGDDNPYSTNRDFQRHLTYREIVSRYKDLEPLYDLENTMSAFYLKPVGNNQYEKCWFDDSLTLSYKYEWIETNGLKGTALWALGYDNSHLKLWNTIADNYTSSTIAKNNLISQPKYFNHHLATFIYDYRYIIGLAGVFYLGFMLLGLVIAFTDWRVRDAFFSNKTLRLLYMLSCIPITLCFYICYMYLVAKRIPAPEHTASILLGLLIGVISTILVFYGFERNRKKLPN